MPKIRIKCVPQPGPGQCVACPEPATAINYAAPSCAACKTFFWRTVTQKKQTVGCRKDGQCDRDLTLRPCRACRFVRCINGGMDPSLVDKNKNPQTTDDPPNAVDSREMRLVPQQLVVAENIVDKELQLLLRIDAAHHDLRFSNYKPSVVGPMAVGDFVRGHSELGRLWRRGPHGLTNMFAQPRLPSQYPFYPVEVIIANEVAISFDENSYAGTKLWLFHDVLHSMQFIKALPLYNKLSDGAKWILLASAFACAHWTTAFYSYSKNSPTTCYPDGSVVTWTPEEEELAPGTARKHTSVIAAMNKAKLDVKEYTLLKMIIVCNPLLDGLSKKDATILTEHRERYSKMLLSYTLAKRGVTTGPALFARLLTTIDVNMKVTSWEKRQHILAMGMGLYVNKTDLGHDIFNSV